MALLDKRPDNIIPALMEECDRAEFSLQIPLIQHIDFQHDLQEAHRRLLTILGVLR